MQPQSPKETLNIFFAVISALLIIYVWQAFFAPAEGPESIPGSEREAFYTVENNTPAAEALPHGARGDIAGVPFENSLTQGSISLAGGRLDDLFLKKYNETADENSKPIHIMTPESGAYFVETGYIPGENTPENALPGKKALWRLAPGSAKKLTPDTPVTLVFENASLRIFRAVSMQDGYLLRYEDTVENLSGAPLALSHYAASDRRVPSEEERNAQMLVHEGIIAVSAGVMDEIGYEEAEDMRGKTYPQAEGWTGITDHYWLTAVIPPKGQPAEIEITPYRPDRGTRRVQTGFIAGETVIPAGKNATFTAFIYAGAKELSALDDTEENLGAARFDRAIDFGWVYFLSKPLFVLLDTLRNLVGNFGLAIIAMTCLVRLALLPLAHKSYVGMQRMKDLQPKILDIRDRFKDDAQGRNMEMMKLYQKEKVNPVTSGCLPMLLQLPVFFALYKVLLVSIEMRHAPFYGWIQDLAAPDPSNIFTLFGLIDWNPPSLLHIGILPLLVGITMYIQQRLSPQPADETQAKIMRTLPFFFVFIMAPFPAGLVLYWMMSNVLSIIQQAYIKYSFNKKNAAKGNA